MPRTKKRKSHAQDLALERGRNKLLKTKHAKKDKEKRIQHLEIRRDLIRGQRRGRGRTFWVLLLLFLQIINIQLLDDVTCKEAVGRVASISSMDRWKLMPVYVHYIKTGNVLVPFI
tara:strand:- start:270 stop:617 length:348 start_codon:yes stop_codon:yes gene_type:complete